MPYTVVHIEKVYAEALRAMAEYMLTAPNEPGELCVRPGRTLDDRYSRSETGYNTSVVADACVRKLLYDLDHQLADADDLRELSQTYHARERDALMAVSFDQVGMDELDRILAHFSTLKVLVKPISKKGKPNRKSPLNLATEYCHQYILRKTSN